MTWRIGDRTRSLKSVDLAGAICPGAIGSVTHDPGAASYADRVVFLADGRVAATGTHEELMAIPAYAALAQAYEAEGGS